jgi:hypothetical protein
VNRLSGLGLQPGPAQPAGQLLWGDGNHGPVAGVTHFDSNGDAGSLRCRPAIRCNPFPEFLGADLQAVTLTAWQPQRDLLQVTRSVRHQQPPLNAPLERRLGSLVNPAIGAASKEAFSEIQRDHSGRMAVRCG